MSLVASLQADFSSFFQATAEAKAALTDLEGRSADVGPALDQRLANTVKTAEEVGRGVRQLAMDVGEASRGFIDAYTEEQDAVQRLTSALQAQGQATPEVVAAYQDMATEFQNTTKYADEAIISAQAVLTTIGKVGPEQMELAMTAVTNLASALNIDLETAASMVAKAFATGGQNLGKLKGIMGDTIQPGMDTAEMLQAINDKFGPAAQNEMQTYNGQMANLNNQMSDLNEQVGKVLVDTLTSLLGVFRELPEGVQTFLIAVGAIGAALAPVLVSLSSLVSLLSTTGLGAGILTAFKAMLAFLGPAGWIAAGVIALAAIIYTNWDTIAAYTQKLYEGIKYWLVEGLNRLVAMVKAPIQGIVSAFQGLYNTLVGHSIIPDTIDGIADQFGRLDEVMVQPVAQASSAVIDHLTAMQFQMRANAILSRNSLFTTASQLEEIARLPIGGGGGGGGGSAAPVTVNNTFNLVDTESNLARKVSEIIMQTVRSGTQLATQ